MKKWLIVLISCLLLLVPTSTFAQENIEAHDEWTNQIGREVDNKQLPGKKSFHTLSLDKSILQLAQELEDAMLKRKTSFTIEYKGDTTNIKEKVRQALAYVLQNNEYLAYDYKSFSWSGRGTSTRFTMNFSVSYYQTLQQVQYVDNQIAHILSQIIHEGMNDHEKVKAVHDYVVLNVAYDQSYNDRLNAPYFALTTGKTMCNGYAMLVYQMLQKLDIPVRLISGTSKGIGHAWNLVQIDGHWYHLDATWDDPVPDVKGRVVYHYYLLTDDMIAKDHFWKTGGLNGWDKPYPAAQTDYAQQLIKLGYDDLAKSLDLHLLQEEYTSYTEKQFVELVAKHFNRYETEFSMRYVGNISSFTSKYRSLIYEAAKKSDAQSWSYSHREYVRTKDNDVIVTISNVKYNQQLQRIKMLKYPTSALTEGETFSLSVAAIFSNGKELNIKDKAQFSNYDKNIISIEKGVIFAKEKGTTSVTVSYQGKQTTFTIEVIDSKEMKYPMAGYKHFGEQVGIDPLKKWKVTFNMEMDKKVDDSMVYVMNRNGEKQSIQLEWRDGKTLVVHPPTEGYQSGETYYLVVEKTMKSSKGKQLKEPITYKFTIK